jgi:hypothetical protein
MSFERPNIEGGESIERQKSRVGNSIQFDLMGFMCKPETGQNGIDEWGDKYADSFRIIFNEVLSRDPEFLDKWDEDIDRERDRSLDFFMGELQRLDGQMKKAA